MISDSAVTTEQDAMALKLGILIIGSLIWDSTDVRRTWRANRLNLPSRTWVPAPIRYGRRSQSRGSSYTMVFSRGLHADWLGQAIVVPCRGGVSSTRDLVDEAQWLWAAERNCSRCGCVSGDWGCVSVVENENRKLPSALRQGWTQHVSGRPGYGRMCGPGGEQSAVGEDGFLAIPWPLEGSDLELDLLLSTTTKPVNEATYPDADVIAEAWSPRGDKNEELKQGSHYIEYFLNNRAHGITTFQDVAIEGHLRRNWR